MGISELFAEIRHTIYGFLFVIALGWLVYSMYALLGGLDFWIEHTPIPLWWSALWSGMAVWYAVSRYLGRRQDVNRALRVRRQRKQLKRSEFD